MSGSRLKARHELFCQRFTAHANAAAAAREAGYAAPSARNHGYRLLRDRRVRERIGEIRAQVARDHCLDAQALMAKLEAVYRKALEYHHLHAAVRAVELQGRLAGLLCLRGGPAEEPGGG
ncbi:MAG: terminase small subunit [Hyphomicrobiales bacterium]|nr:terminase small subunit [Hyphomicrobiales bacterium]MCP5370694.1 terminase small subunit [Hyphomicrobiales bacterium]